MATTLQREQHAREFTTVEVEVLTLWNALQDQGFGALARDLLDAGLMHEHFNSLLDSDPAARSADDNQTLARLQALKETLFAKARAALGGIVDSRQP